MNRRLSILFIFMLLFQTVSGSVVVPAQTLAEGKEPEESIFGEETEVTNDEGDVTGYKVPWSVEGMEELEVSYTKQLTNEVVFEETSGELVEDSDVGTYEVSEAGLITVAINEDFDGSEDVNGVIIAEVEIEEIEEDKVTTKEEPTEEEQVESDNDGEGNEADSLKPGTNSTKSAQNETKISKDAKGERETPLKSTSAAEEKQGFNLELSKVTDLDGKVYNEEYLLDPKDEFKLDLKWDLIDGHNYKKDDTVTFNLPQGIKIQEQFEVELISGNDIVANAVVKTDGTVELIFTDFVETHNTVTGEMQIISKIDEDNAELEDGEIVLKPIGEEGEIRIPIDLGEREKTIEKKGTPNKGYNADEIDWEVTINKQKINLENAKITDELPAGTQYKEESLKVYKIKTSLNGKFLEEEIVEGIQPTIDEDGNIEVSLGSIKDKYRIEYVTTVMDDEENKFKNNATLVDDKLESISADATITINRGDPIKKSAAKSYNPKTGIIEWKLEFNFNQKDLNDITLKDTWTTEPEHSMSLVEDSLKFQEVTIDENGHATNVGEPVNLLEGASLVNGNNQFEVTGITTDKAYVVTYQTKVDERVLKGFRISNTAGFGGKTDGSGTGVGAYYGSKSAGNVNYKNKTIDWTIELNHDEYPMEKISIKDTLGDGLTLDKESIEVTVDGKNYDKEEHGDYTVSGDNPFELKFPDTFKTDKKITIKYKTNFIADDVTDNLATNKADLTWTPEGGSKSITKEVKAETPLNKKTEENSWKNGSYDPKEKEITWTIYTNYRENQIDDLIIKDEPQGNQKIIEGSAVVTELEILANGKTTDSAELDKDVSAIDTANNSLKVTIGETNKAYKIEYKTSIRGLSDIQKEYINKAEVFDGEESLSEIDAKVGITKAHTYGAKSGEQDGKQIHWSVTVNPGQQKVKNLELVDEISENQDYLTDTFKVYEAEVDSKGNATKKGKPISKDKYTLTHTAGELTFTVKWKETVERAFIVEYSTLYFEGHNGKVTNSYNVTGDNIVEGGSTDGEGSVTIKQYGTGSGSGEAGYLVVDKVNSTYGIEKDEDGNYPSLAGAKFNLVDADTGTVLKSGTTDENGQIDFGRLLFGEYKLVETKIPEGYVTPNEEQEIKINKPYKSGDNKESFEYKIENYKPVFEIKVFKKDKTEEDKTLPGAEFTLFKDDQTTVIETKVAGEDGSAHFKGLEKGTYYVQETKAPLGYTLDSTEKKKVVIGEKERKAKELTFKNTPRGAVILEKIDIDTEEKLKGVEFKLQKKNESGVYETVGEAYTTDKNGQIQTENTLEAGDYQFVETKPLNGYRENKTPIKFTVDINKTTDLKLETIKNEKFKGSIKLIKKDAATGERLEGAVFKLVDSEGKLIKEGLTTKEDEEIVVDNLPLGEYQLIETKAPAGYELDETPIVVKVEADEQVVEPKLTNDKITNISVKKEWNNGNGDTEPVTVKLLPTEETKELNKENGWTATFEGLRVYGDGKKKIEYEVEELDVDGYQSDVTGDVDNGFTVTNTELTQVTVMKKWLDDDLSKDRPEKITIHLIANGDKEEPIESVEISGLTNEETYIFEDLPKYDLEGEEILYTVDEGRVEGYEASITPSDTEGIDFEIENKRVGKTKVEGTKIWQDEGPESRPESITVNLLQNGTVIDSIDVTADDNWEYSFKDLDQFDENGLTWGYTVDEEPVEGYSKSAGEGNDLVNTRIGKTEVSGKKIWQDNDDATGDRPDSITVNLLQNGSIFAVEEVTPDEDGEWGYSFKNLPKFDDNGVAWGYTVDEEPVEGYSKSAGEGNDLVNTRIGKTEVSGKKIWQDNDDATGDRPDSITVNLLQNGSIFAVEEVTPDEDGEWRYSFKNLPKFDDNGVAWGYTVDEEPVEGYSKSAGENNDLINTRLGITEVSGTKFWQDEDMSERPDSIKVNLLQNGVLFTVEEVMPNANGDWEYNFTHLPKFDSEGKAYEYTVTEHDVPGYDSNVDGFDMTNTRADKKSITITKAWVDGHSKDRPGSIEVELFRSITEGEKESVDVYEVKSSDDWSLEITDLPAFDADGNAYTYEINEKDVAGYESEVNGFDITNTRIGTLSVDGTKTWVGDAASDRPSSIVVELMQNADKIEEKEVTAKTDWKYSFIDLPAFDENGVAYEYTVAEQEVAGYTSKVDGYDITNTLIPVTPESGDSDGSNGSSGSDESDGSDGSSKSDESDKSTEGVPVPETATNIFNLMLIGFGLIVLGLVSFFIRRRNAA